MIGPNWPNWFRQMWPGEQKRHAVLREYASIGGTCQNFLTDIALRNGVWGESHARDLFEAGIAEGRRRAVLEILKLCKTPPDQLFNIVPKKHQGEN